MTQKPQREGVKDMPAIPADLHKYKTPALGDAIARVPDKTSPEQCRGKA
jgi:hypothetical protein